MASLSISKDPLQSYLIRRSTTDKLFDDCNLSPECKVVGTPPSPSTLSKKNTNTFPSPMSRAKNSRPSRRELNYKKLYSKQMTQPPLQNTKQKSTSYGSTKSREIQRQFQLAEQKYIHFLRSIIENIIHPLRMMFLRLKLSDADMAQFNIIFDIALSLYRFHAHALHKLSSHSKKSGARAKKAPIFRFYAQFPRKYAKYFGAAFKAVTELSPIMASQTALRKWFADKCCAIMLLYDTTHSTPYQSFAEILRDISIHCVEQSQKLQDLALSKYFIMNKDACAFRQDMQTYLEKSYIRKWNTEYRQKFDLMHLEMTLTDTAIANVSELKMAEDQCTSELDRLNQQMNALNEQMGKLDDLKALQKSLEKEATNLPVMTSVTGMSSIPELPEENESKQLEETAMSLPKCKVPTLNHEEFPRPQGGGLKRPSLMQPTQKQKGFMKAPSLMQPPMSMQEPPPSKSAQTAGLKISISQFGKHSNHLPMRPKVGDDPTPVTNKQMFDYVSRIDMWKRQIKSVEMETLMWDPSVSPSPSPGADGQFVWMEQDEDEEDEDSDLTTDIDSESGGTLVEHTSTEEEDEEDEEEDGSDDDEYNSSDYSSEDDDEGFSFMQFLTEHAKVEQDTVYAQNGYKKLHKCCDTVQGELLKALEMESNTHVVIKKADLALVADHITIKDEVSCFVTENRVKEGQILKYLTQNEMELNQYIVEYKDFFESEDDCYLVMEYVQSGINMKQFVQISQKYIRQKKLKLQEYRQTVKRLFWQLALTIHWLHDTMHCCHLDLCLENIMLKNCSFSSQPDGYLRINPETSLKLGDFGVAEVFQGSFDCTKQDLSIDNQSYLAPQVVQDQIYDARAADMWCLGMLLYFIMTGERLYEPMEAVQSAMQSTSLVSSQSDSLSSIVASKQRGRQRSSLTSLSTGFMCNGYSALHGGMLKQYLTITEQVDRFESSSFQLMLKLLKVKESARFTAIKVLEHKWFRGYYRKHKELIANQPSNEQVMQTQEMNDFPFYQMN